jgi:HK97 family phage portal protein
MAVLATRDGNVSIKSNPITGGYSNFQSTFTSGWGPLVNLINDGARSYGQLYREQPYLKAAVDLISQGVAILPLKSYDRSQDGEKSRLIDHPLPNVLARPHNRMSPFRFKEWMLSELALNGNSLAVMVENPEVPNAPLEIWPVPWPFVIVQGGSEPEVYHVNLPQGRFSFPAKRCFHLRFAESNPWYPLIGLSPVETLRRTLQNEDGAARWTTSVFKNSGRPSGILTTEQKLNPDQLKAVRDQAQEIYGGPDNAFRVAVMQGGLKWEPVAFNAVETGLMSVRQWNREEVAAVYHVPPSMLGDLSRATFSNVTENRRMFYTSSLPPYITLFEEEFYAQVISQVPGWEQLYVEFDTNEVLKGSAKERAETYAIARRYMTVNEIRDRENLPRIDKPEYDEVWEPINETPIGAAHQPTAPNPDVPSPADTPPKSLLEAFDRLERAASSTIGSGRKFEFSDERFARELIRALGDDPATVEWASRFAQAVGDVLIGADTLDSIRQGLELLKVAALEP